jgi:hypothetical protein
MIRSARAGNADKVVRFVWAHESIHGVWTKRFPVGGGGDVYLPQPAWDKLKDGSIIPNNPEPVFLYRVGGGERTVEGEKICSVGFAKEPPELSDAGKWEKLWRGLDEDEQFFELKDERLYPQMYTGTLRALVQAKLTLRSQTWGFVYNPDAANQGLAISPDGVYWLIHIGGDDVRASRLDNTSAFKCKLEQITDDDDKHLFMAFIYRGLKTTKDEAFRDILIGAGISTQVREHGVSIGTLKSGAKAGWAFNADGSKAVKVTQRTYQSTWDARFMEAEYAIWNLNIAWNADGIPSASISQSSTGTWDGGATMVESLGGWSPFMSGWISQNPALGRGIVRAWYHQETDDLLTLGFSGARPEVKPGKTAFEQKVWCGVGGDTQKIFRKDPMHWPEQKIGLLDTEGANIETEYMYTGGDPHERTRESREGDTQHFPDFLGSGSGSWSCEETHPGSDVVSMVITGGRPFPGNYAIIGLSYQKDILRQEFGGYVGVVIGVPSDPESGVSVAKFRKPERLDSISEGSSQFGRSVGGERAYIEAGGRVAGNTFGSHKQKNSFVGGIVVFSDDKVSSSESTDEEDEFLGLQLYGRRALIDETEEPEDDGGTPWNNWFEWQVLENPVAGPVITQSAHDSVFYTLYFGEGLSNCALSDEAINAVKLGWVGGV